MNYESEQNKMRGRVVVIGGGLAGLAASAALAEHGADVTLLESRPRLGGRASSFLDTTTNELIDNCQHVALGCCTNFLHLCKSLGVADQFHRESELCFIGPAGTRNRFSAGLLPAPFHLMSSFRRLDYLSRADKRALARGLRKLAAEQVTPDDPRSFLDWLKTQNQPQSAIDRFWHVVLVSALSETLDRIDIPNARKVFVDSFLANKRGWEMLVSKDPLDVLYDGKITDELTSRGVTIRLQSGVNQLQIQNGRIASAELRSGETISADYFILAVPHHQVAKILPEQLRESSEFSQLEKLETAPISSVHLWFDRPAIPNRHAVLIGRLSQWVFNRTELLGKKSGQGYSYQVVISASREIKNRSQDDVLNEVLNELQSIWPEANRENLTHWRMVTEHRAVFSVRPGSEQFRPNQQSSIENLQLAGDWTKTGWPATMEGAVRSGFLAAENILNQSGSAAKLLQDDLPISCLSKIAFGL